MRWTPDDTPRPRVPSDELHAAHLRAVVATVLQRYSADIARCFLAAPRTMGCMIRWDGETLEVETVELSLPAGPIHRSGSPGAS